MPRLYGLSICSFTKLKIIALQSSVIDDNIYDMISFFASFLGFVFHVFLSNNHNIVVCIKYLILFIVYPPSIPRRHTFVRGGPAPHDRRRTYYEDLGQSDRGGNSLLWSLLYGIRRTGTGGTV